MYFFKKNSNAIKDFISTMQTVPQLRKVLQEDHSLLTMMKDEASSTLKHGTTTATQTDVLMLPSSLSQQRKRALKRRMKLTKRMTKIAGTFSKVISQYNQLSDSLIMNCYE